MKKQGLSHNISSCIALVSLLLTFTLSTACSVGPPRSDYQQDKYDRYSIGHRTIRVWGQQGSLPGEFNNPTGIAIYGKKVFVSDSGNNRIQVFDLKGNYLYQIGKEGSGPGELKHPMHLDIRGNRLYVAEFLNHRIQIFTLNGDPISIIGQKGTGKAEFDGPTGVAVTEDGLIFVSEYNNQRVQILNSYGEYITHIGTTRKAGNGPGEFYNPTDVTTLPDKNIAVADGYNDRVQIISRQGEFIEQWGRVRSSSISRANPSKINVVMGIQADPRGNLILADIYNNRLQIFEPDGRFLGYVGQYGNKKGQLNLPTDIAFDKRGNVYVVDSGNHRIQKFRY